MEDDVFVAFGANLCRGTDGPGATLEAALARLAATPGMTFRARAGWYASPAYPPGAGPDFVNGVAAFATRLSPEDTLARLHEVEAALGRVRGARWGPRVVDLDLLAHGATVRPDSPTQADWAALGPSDAAGRMPEGLILPHPRLAERAFVLLPWAEIAPSWRHPLTGRSVAEMAAALPAEEVAATRPLGAPLAPPSDPV